MISVIVIFLYMLFTCYVIGFACMHIIAGKSTFRCQAETSYLFAGVGIITVYSQIFSLFAKVGLAANVMLLFLCVISILAYKTELLASLHSLRLTITPGKAAVIALLFLLFAYGTSTGVIHYDTGLYHAQSIRWIEEYGVIPGLGNLHSRLAYNSAGFCFSALYSMAFLGGQSFHCTAGFLAFSLALVCAEGCQKNRSAKPKLSDFARIMGIYYLLQIYDEMISPASDYFMVLFVFFIMIRWLDLLEREEIKTEEKSYLPYAFLSLLCVIVLTIKLSGACLLLLALKPATMLLQQKKKAEICKFLGLGVCSVFPFLVRNIILSGWLVYPFTAIDLFTFDFKIPKGMAEYDAREIQVYGRGISDVTRYGESMQKWFPEWLEKLDNTNKIFLTLAVSGLVLFILFGIYAFFKKKRDMIDYLHAAGTMSICFLFWLSTAPLVRYGCVFLWLTGVLTWGYLYLRVSPHIDRYKIFYIALIVFGIYKLAAFGVELRGVANTKYLFVQKDYENFETIPYTLHGYTFYYPRQGDRTGYKDFPASPIMAEDIFRGKTIKEGFRDVIH